jgi:hypothetical protein
MNKKIFLMIDNALEVKKKVVQNIYPKHILYGFIELEDKLNATIENYTLMNVLSKRKGDIVVTNRAKYLPLLKILGVKTILINMNSNHDLTLYPGMKNRMIYLLNKKLYKSCDVIICLSKVQLKKLKSIGATNIHVLPLGVDWNLIRKVKTSEEYFLSSGFDKGKNFGFVEKALEGINLKILNGKIPLRYDQYLKALGKAKAVVFNLDVSKKSSSDLSGTTTSFEALLLGKPIFTNYQPWLKELFKENYHIYKNEKELRLLTKKNIKFKKLNYDYLTLEHFTKRLEEIIKLF